MKSRGNTASRLATIAFTLLASLPSAAQVPPDQTSTGATTTTCEKTGPQMVCTTVVKYTLPPGVALQTGSVGAGNFVLNATSGGPTCNSLTAVPSTVASGVPTPITLTFNGCGANTTYNWPQNYVVQAQPNSAVTPALTLIGTATQTYSVEACAPACQPYTVTVGVTQATPPLSDCKIITPPPVSINTAQQTTLTASCSQGAGAGSGVEWQWKRNGQNVGAKLSTLNSSTHTVLGTIGQGNYTYTVDVSNNAPSTLTTAALQVTVSTLTTSSCPSGLTVPARTIVAGEPYSTWYSSGHPGNTPYVIAIDVPTNNSSLPTTPGVINFAQKTGPGAREYTISRSPCDFAAPVQSYGYDKVDISYDPNFVPYAHGYYLAPGRWYLNLRSTACSPTVTCTMNMQAQP